MNASACEKTQWGKTSNLRIARCQFVVKQMSRRCQGVRDTEFFARSLVRERNFFMFPVYETGMQPRG